MRFMMLMIPKDYATAPADARPDAKTVAAMAKYNRQLVEAGVMLTGEGLHLAEGFLLGEIAYAAGVEEHDVRAGFLWGNGIAAGNQLGRDGLAVPLVHLAAIRLDENTWHNAKIQQLGTLAKFRVKKMKRSTKGLRFLFFFCICCHCWRFSPE